MNPQNDTDLLDPDFDFYGVETAESLMRRVLAAGSIS